MRKVLVTTERIGAENVKRLSRLSEVIETWRMNEAEILAALPLANAAIVLGWPSFFTRENLSRMPVLKFIQTVSVGVNQVRFDDLPDGVTVSSNAGAYSTEVGEHAWALALVAAKKIVPANTAINIGGGTFESYREHTKDTMVLKGKTMGIVAYGGIGRTVARFARAFGMNVIALSRSSRKEKGVKIYRGTRGLERILELSDVVLLSIPLTKSTAGMIGATELALMRKEAILVNVSRGDIIDQRALYEHLSANPSFRYATDVWWYKDGKETLVTEWPFGKLPNFVGTPHSSGPAGVSGGEPQKAAVGNTIRFLRGFKPKNVMDPSEYRAD